MTKLVRGINLGTTSTREDLKDPQRCATSPLAGLTYVASLAKKLAPLSSIQHVPSAYFIPRTIS